MPDSAIKHIEKLARIIGPCGVMNTGEAGGELTARNDGWI